jgi:hypothetical protein
MREIDELRIMLFRTFRRHSTNHPNIPPNEVIGYWEMPLGIVQSISRILQDRFKLLSSIKLQAYGRGLLVRLRDLKLVTTRTVGTWPTGYGRKGNDWLRIRWDNDKLVERARGDRALRGSRTALGTPKSAIWRDTTYNRRVDDNWLYGQPGAFTWDKRWHSTLRHHSASRPKVWDRWITRRLKVEAHYNKRHRLGVKLLDFGEP